MSENDKPAHGARTLIIAASIIVVIAGLKAASNIILPFLMAMFLAMISLPLLTQLQKWRVPPGLAVLLTVVTEISILVGIVTLVGGSIKAFTEAAPQYQVRLEAIIAQVTAWLNARGIDISTELDLDLINPGMAFDLVSGALKSVASVLSNIVLVLLIIILILFEAAGFPGKLEAAFGRRHASARYEKIRQEVLRYLGIKTLVSIATGGLVAGFLAVLGIDFPLLWGLLAFMLNYIPNLGSILAAIPPVLLAVISHGPGRAIMVAVVFVAVNLTLGNFVEPYFMGRRLGLSTLVVFLSLVFWGWIWGPVGMLLSVPLTMIVKIMLENTKDFKWMAVLLDASPGLPTKKPR